MKLLMLGAPGVGKGTQAKLLSNRLGIPHVSSGDLLRQHIARGTSLGIRAKKLMDQGKMVPDIIRMVKKRLNMDDCSPGFILDGYPRNLEHVETLKGFVTFDKVIYLVVDDDTIVDRLAGRRLCNKCHAIYHRSFYKGSSCTQCDGTLYQRDDDTPDAIRVRLQLFRETTFPLVAHYANQGILLEIDGSGTTEKVEARIIEGFRQGKRGQHMDLPSPFKIKGHIYNTDVYSVEWTPDCGVITTRALGHKFSFDRALFKRLLEMNGSPYGWNGWGLKTNPKDLSKQIADISEMLQELSKLTALPEETRTQLAEASLLCSDASYTAVGENPAEDGIFSDVRVAIEEANGESTI